MVSLHASTLYQFRRLRTDSMYELPLLVEEVEIPSLEEIERRLAFVDVRLAILNAQKEVAATHYFFTLLYRELVIEEKLRVLNEKCC